VVTETAIANQERGDKIQSNLASNSIGGIGKYAMTAEGTSDCIIQKFRKQQSTSVSRAAVHIASALATA